MKRCALVFLLIIMDTGQSLLYPKESETRDVYSLNGLWYFVLTPASDPLIGFTEKWYRQEFKYVVKEEILLMPVPSSYNDITQNIDIRDHTGVVWYEKTFFLPKSWKQNDRICLRFSSVSYAAKVWINGDIVTTHEIGHLPFEVVINSYVKFGTENRITVTCNNTLLNDTIPQGQFEEIETDNGNITTQTYTFDFFNYAGIDRPVVLYTTPWNYIEDIYVKTTILNQSGIIEYAVPYTAKDSVKCIVNLVDKNGVTVARAHKPTGIIHVENAKFWWPYLMDNEPGYLYTLEVKLFSNEYDLLDVYRQPIGIREILWNDGLFINNRPMYLQGFGRHEDTDIRGKGLDLPTIIKDHNLIKWVGANCYRTSHYPYSDEIMQVADELGIMIIDECSSVNTDIFSNELLEKHKKSLTELIERDKNHPSVIMWSVGNEARTANPNASAYFKEVVARAKALDKTRPVTMAVNANTTHDVAGQYLDIISFNNYFSWYQYTGNLNAITSNVVKTANAWYSLHNKPVLMSEYGADTIAGLHISPPFAWSEEYQVAMMSKHFQAFDHLRKNCWFIGEFIWNFADFQTQQSYTRVGGNKKGIFTRNRQPKSSAHHLRKRYFRISNELYNSTLPTDLDDYVFDRAVPNHTEL